LLQSGDQDTLPVSTLSDPISESIDERSRIIAALNQHDGNMTLAARELGIHRTTLWRKLKRYKISD
jgi:transcriptional regulator of acetoin/glycerol metabolism